MTSSHAMALSALSDERALSRYVNDARRQLREQWQPARGGRAWNLAHSEVIDAVVRRLFALAGERASAAGSVGGGVAVLATGGYGQRALAPFSDVDLTFLADRDDDPAILREAFRLVMEVLVAGARIKVGYAYRHLSDIGKEELDHQTQTALLDARLVAGDGGLFARFDPAFFSRLPIADFLFRKEAERRRVRQRAGETPFEIEPDLKEGAGGLRDLQTALWMARARFDKSGDALWRELVRRKILTRDEMRALQEAREHLYRVRNLVHLLAGERRERFSIAWQEAAAGRLGFADRDDSPAVEPLMHTHYAYADCIARLSEKIVQRCLDAPLALGVDSGLSSLRRSVVVTEPRRAAADPLWPLAALEFCQRYDLEISSAAIEAMEERVAAWGDTLPAGAGTRFFDLLSQPGDILATVRRMRRTGLLRALLPELDACMTLIPYDSTHRYTVGEHTLRVLGNLVRLRPEGQAPAAPDGMPPPDSFCEQFGRIAQPAALFLGALLHDVGKQWPRLKSGKRAPHEITGAEAALTICARLGVPPAVAERVSAVVRHHLVLAEVSRLRDLSRPETVREVIRSVPDLDLLRMLYALTWADTSAVGRGVWTGMAGRLLDELFERTAAALEGPEPGAVRDAEAEARRMDALRERLRRRLASAGAESAAADASAIQAHIERMPTAYLLNTPPETISRHLALIAALADEGVGGVVTDYRTLADNRQTELTLVTQDAKGLLARITGVLHAFDIQLHAAQVFTRADGDRGVVIDTLEVDFRGAALDRSLRGELASALRRVLRGEEELAQLLARRRRLSPALGAVAALRLDGGPGDDLVILDVTFQRGAGGIHALAATLTGLDWNIHAARLSTWAGNARCAVYLTHALQGGPGSDEARETLRKTLLAIEG